LITQITTSVTQSMPADIAVDDALTWILAAWEQEEDGVTPIGLLREVIIMNFHERYDGIFELLSLEIDIEHISLSKYRKEIQ